MHPRPPVSFALVALLFAAPLACQCGPDRIESLTGPADAGIHVDAGVLEPEEDAGTTWSPPDAGLDAGPDPLPDAGEGPVEPTFTCELRPPVQPLQAELYWKDPGTPPHVHVQTTPLVIDVDGNGAADVVAIFFAQNPVSAGAVLRAIDGQSGAILWQSTETDLKLNGGIAAGDLSGAGEITIVAQTSDGRVVGHSALTGQRLWVSHDSNGAVVSFPTMTTHPPTLVNLDAKGDAEIVYGARVLSSTGLVLWDRGQGTSVATGGTMLVADVDGDGLPELTDGTKCFNGNGTLCNWSGKGLGGLAAVADFVDAQGVPGRDGKPEIVSVLNGSIALVDGRTGKLLGQPTMFASTNGGGPPAVADFDGDGHPEVGVSGYDRYFMLKLVPGVTPPQWTVLWTAPVQDYTSGTVSSAAFDFDRDGIAEAVVADERSLQVFHGADGTLLLKLPHCSGTAIEGPAIADVGGDGLADIVFGSHYPTSQCEAGLQGIFVYRGKGGGWAPARPIWNQHTYHVTNVCDGQDQVCGGPGAPENTYARIPLFEKRNWTTSNDPSGVETRPLNNYRQNNLTSRTGTLLPDLRPHEVRVDTSECPAAVGFTVNVGNAGERATAPGMKVAFVEVGTGEVLAVAEVPVPIAPGKVVEVRATWFPPSNQTWPVEIVARADDDGTDVGTELECLENNNESAPSSVSCG